MGISYLQFNDDLTLIRQEIKRKTITKTKQAVNHIFIYDRSGSMSGTLHTLINQMVGLVKKIPMGDTISIGWFSSEGGEFDYIVKGFKVTDKCDYKDLESIIKKNNTTIGCTCFSEILQDSKSLITNLSSFSNLFSLAFFTDGYPCVSNTKKELDSIFKAIDDIKGNITSSMIIGYGYYYNKELLTQMAEQLNSILISSTEIKEYEGHITKLINLTQNMEPKEVIDPVTNNVLAIFTVTDSGVVANSISNDDKIYVTPEANKPTNIFYLTSDKPNKKSWDKIEDINYGEGSDINAKAMYGASLILTQKAKNDVALTIMGKIGDVSIIDKLNSAFTIDEYSSVESLINDCISDVSKRFECGKDENYLPKPDAFCVFNVLDMLMNDPDANFFPYHEKFNYEKISIGTVTKSDYPKFNADKDVKCPFDSLTWNNTKLNLSVKSKIKGSIRLNAINGITPASVGLVEDYPTFVWRNYTFIKDGRSNIKTFYIDSSEATYKIFKNVGIVVDDTFNVNKRYGVNISKLPVINKVISDVNLSAEDMGRKAFRELELCGILKALKNYKKVLNNPFNIQSDQTVVLEGNGIGKDGSFSPPSEIVESTDKYYVKSFEIKVKGYSSLPSVKAVLDKISASKNRTASEMLVETGIQMYNSNKQHLLNESMETAWLDAKIGECNKELKELRTSIQKTKFAIILGKKWFKEFSSLNESTITIDNKNFNFVLSEEVVKI